MSGLFYTFNIAKRGMAANQTSLNVLSHNTSNMITPGYSRQRAIHKTTDPFPMPSLNRPIGPGQLGTGVEVAAITRARDEFLDNSIRKETGTLLQNTAKNKFLTSIEGIINEPGDTGISSTLNKFWDSWQELSTNPENATARKLVISSSKAMVDSFRQTYTQLEDLEKELSGLQKDYIFEVNSILKQVADLNEQIKQVTISGQTPNDLMDRRDVLLDKLSESINYKIEKGDFNSIRIVTADSNGNEKYLVTDSRVVTGIASIEDVKFDIAGKGSLNKADFPVNIKSNPDGSFTPPINMEFKVYIDGDVSKPMTKKVTINNTNDLKQYFNIDQDKDNIRIDSLKNSNLMYNKSINDPQKAIDEAGNFEFTKGAIKGLESEKVEIANYKNQINDMVRTISIAINTVHSNGKASDPEVEPYINFFNDVSNEDHPAKKIKINEIIEKDPSKINAGTEMVNPDAGDNARAKRIAELRNLRLDIPNIKSKDDFIKKAFGDAALTDPNFNFATAETIQSNSGDTIESYYKGMIAELGVSSQEAKRVVENQKQLLMQLNNQKESVSGVSMDEEMVDMLQFQKGYQANAKVINVIDELLDLVVNRLIR